MQPLSLSLTLDIEMRSLLVIMSPSLFQLIVSDMETSTTIGSSSVQYQFTSSMYQATVASSDHNCRLRYWETEAEEHFILKSI